MYRWFLPLLRMDTVPKFVQLIHQVQQETGTGNARVRPPRLPVTGAELEETRAIGPAKRCAIRPRCEARHSLDHKRGPALSDVLQSAPACCFDLETRSTL